MQFVTIPAGAGARLLPAACTRVSLTPVRSLILVMLVWCLHTTVSADEGETTDNSSSLASCLLPDAGAPSCGIESAPGSSQYKSNVPHKVGNPIDVVSGNKYQYELDYQSPVSGLALARHYNSSLSDYDVGLGPGWRHSYQVVLTRVSDEQLNIVQSDGRLISFYRQAGDPDGVFRAALQSDGYLQLGDRSVWSMGDGRRLLFQGSYLVRMELGERAGVLTLHYQNGKLDTVTDQHSQSLTFNYVPGTPSLPTYGSEQSLQPAGSIESVVMPNGDIIQYNYGDHGNSIGVRYPDGDSVGYVYGNENWPSHLTRRQSTVDDRLSEWRYDEQGLGIAWLEGGGINGLDIERDLPLQGGVEGATVDQANTATTQARVTYADGRETNYRWSPGSAGLHESGDAVDISCDNCLPQTSPTTTDSESAADTLSGIGTDPTSQEDAVSNKESLRALMSPMDKSVQSMLTDMTLTSDQPEPGTGRSLYHGIYPHQQGDVSIEMTTDRLGEVKNLKIGEVTLAQLMESSMAGQLQPCFSDSSPENSATFSHDRIAALGHGEAPCDLDPLVTVEFGHSVKTFLKADSDTIQSKSAEGVAQKQTVPWWHDLRRYCGLPAGLSCEQLDEDLDMALLSRCAYGGESCEPAFRLVSPSEIGMANDRFDDNGFDAQLYQDPDEPDRYILVFRGTDNVGDDWPNNFAQAASEPARQYDLALNLGRDVVKELPGKQVEFSGHSLGGGLASVAALETQRPATVFNTAALQPGTAARYGLEDEYRDADTYIRHLHTDYDPVTVMQEVVDDIEPRGYGDFQTAPGQFTEIPNPDIPWVNDVNANAETLGEGLFPIIWHSMDAVIHVLESLKEFNCSP